MYSLIFRDEQGKQYSFDDYLNREEAVETLNEMFELASERFPKPIAKRDNAGFFFPVAGSMHSVSLEYTPY